MNSDERKWIPSSDAAVVERELQVGLLSEKVLLQDMAKEAGLV